MRLSHARLRSASLRQCRRDRTRCVGGQVELDDLSCGIAVCKTNPTNVVPGCRREQVTRPFDQPPEHSHLDAALARVPRNSIHQATSALVEVGNRRAETGLAGWGGRIRTCAFRFTGGRLKTRRNSPDFDEPGHQRLSVRLAELISDAEVRILPPQPASLVSTVI